MCVCVCVTPGRYRQRLANQRNHLSAVHADAIQNELNSEWMHNNIRLVLIFAPQSFQQLDVLHVICMFPFKTESIPSRFIRCGTHFVWSSPLECLFKAILAISNCWYFWHVVWPIATTLMHPSIGLGWTEPNANINSRFLHHRPRFLHTNRPICVCSNVRARAQAHFDRKIRSPKQTSVLRKITRGKKPKKNNTKLFSVSQTRSAIASRNRDEK